VSETKVKVEKQIFGELRNLRAKFGREGKSDDAQGDFEMFGLWSATVSTFIAVFFGGIFCLRAIGTGHLFWGIREKFWRKSSIGTGNTRQCLLNWIEIGVITC
jgi:hypothetical protein